MTLTTFTTRHRPRIARELGRLTALSSSFASPWAQDIEDRFSAMAMGKALRGILTLVGYGAVAGRVTPEATRLAAIIELLHLSLIVHDDIIDQDLIRRGKPSLFAQYATLARKRTDATHVGMSLALCAGDVAIFRATQALSALAGARPAAGRAADTVLRFCIETGFGEIEDVAIATGLQAADEKSITNMLIRKTARYSCSMPLAAGARLAGASPALATQLEALGEDLGLIFQLRDDELGLFGTTAEIGKPAGSDIREGKQTLYTLYLNQAVSPAERKKLARIYGSADAGEAEFQYVRGLVRSHGADKKVARLIARREKQAAERIAALKIPVAYRDLLTETLAYVSGRKS